MKQREMNEILYKIEDSRRELRKIYTDTTYTYLDTTIEKIRLIKKGIEKVDDLLTLMITITAQKVEYWPKYEMDKLIEEIEQCTKKQ
jgi:hypothetical protein